MRIPCVRARIKQRDESPSAHVPPPHAGLFVAVAPEAAPAKICEFSRTALRLGNGMVNCELVTGEFWRGLAVFAQSTSPFPHTTF